MVRWKVSVRQIDTWHKSLRHGGGQNARGFQPVALLVTAGKGHGFVVGSSGVAGIGHAHRRDVHRRTAVDHVTDAALARIAARQLMPLVDPFLRVEQPLYQRRLALQLGHPTAMPDDLAHHAFGHIPRIEMAALAVVDPHQSQRHCGVIGDDTVTAYPTVALRRVLPVPVPNGAQGGDAAIAVADLSGGKFLDGRPHGVAESDAMDDRPDAAPKVGAAFGRFGIHRTVLA